MNEQQVRANMSVIRDAIDKGIEADKRNGDPSPVYVVMAVKSGIALLEGFLIDLNAIAEAAKNRKA